jgi:hypothetical protein
MKKTEIYRKSVENMGTKICNKLPGFLKEIDDYRVFRKKLKMFLLLKSFYSVEEFVSTEEATKMYDDLIVYSFYNR